ncbi:MAG: hypothetical protein HC929_20345 [Leptolyngbyaceae cyanobacterium SM2_5_2]|nr:hypothetical protein [Leptolyngbyaceae cyanobacterium SM2_5_2]
MANRVASSCAVASVLAFLGLAVAMPAAWAQAQSINPDGDTVVDPNAGFGSTDGSSGLFGEGSSPFDLIHRAVLMNEMSLSDFSRQHQNRISTEAANFRSLQQEALRRQAAPEATDNEATPEGTVE